MDTAARVKDHVYRIYQEALSNALKHAGATRFEVRLGRSGKQLRLEIRDDGQGFDAARAAADGKGLGLSTIRERAELLGGVVRLTSSRGRGTTVQVEVPVE